MDWKIFITVFGSVFIAELGDKTQLATLLFASDRAVSKWLVFASASLALIAASALAVAGGAVLTHYVDEKTLRVIAGAAFIGIGVWMLVR